MTRFLVRQQIFDNGKTRVAGRQVAEIALFVRFA